MGLIGEECDGSFKTYHFDSRGSTVAITDIGCNVTDAFTYDTYGNEIEHIGNSSVIFGYNGRDGVVTDKNGLIYMRARYYSPEMRRFVNADILHGEISDSTSLNRYSYVNGNPVSFVDPFGLVKDDKGEKKDDKGEKIDRTEYINSYMENTNNQLYKLLQSWGFSLTKSVYDTSEQINMLYGGFVVTLCVDISFETPLDSDVVSDVSLDTGYTINEATTSELKIPLTNIGTKAGAYLDEDRLSAGLSTYISSGEWTYGSKQQIGLYSDACITSLSYKPEDKYLPTVTVSIDNETHHLAKAAVAAFVVACVYVPELVAAAAPTASEFLQNLSNAAPSFSYAM